MRQPQRLRVAPLFFLALACCFGCDDEADAQEGWYDATPLLESVRRAERADLAAQVGVNDLTVLPLYDLRVQLEPGSRDFGIDEELWFTNTTGGPLSEIVLRVFANAVGAPGAPPAVRLASSECHGVVCQVGWDGQSAITFTPPSPLAAGGQLRLRLRLEGQLRQIEPHRTNLLAQAFEGLGRMGQGHSEEGEGDYGLLAHGDSIASFANFYAVVAPRRGGAWVRSERSTMGDLGSGGMSHVRATLITPPNFKIASTGVTVHERTVLANDSAPARHETQVVAAAVRDFAFLASPRFRVAVRHLDDITIRSWYLDGEQASGDKVLEAAGHAVGIFQQRFGTYPYTELDVVEAPLVGGAGGVEFSGLVTVASMFYRPMAGGQNLGALTGLLGGGGGQIGRAMVDPMLEFVTAHEVAHQWWHGIVGSDSRQHPFVDESLAQYSAILYMEERHGAERALEEANRQVAQNYHMMRLGGQLDGAVDQPVDAFSDEVAYAGLVYGKGPFFYREVRASLGDAAFFASLQRYVRQNRFRSAGHRAIVDALAQGPRAADVRLLATRWLEESHGDEDLGQPDMDALLGSWLGTDAVQQVGGLLQNLLGGLSGAGVQLIPAPGGPAGATTPPRNVDPADLQEAQRALQEAMRAIESMQTP